MQAHGVVPSSIAFCRLAKSSGGGTMPMHKSGGPSWQDAPRAVHAAAWPGLAGWHWYSSEKGRTPTLASGGGVTAAALEVGAAGGAIVARLQPGTAWKRNKKRARRVGPAPAAVILVSWFVSRPRLDVAAVTTLGLFALTRGTIRGLLLPATPSLAPFPYRRLARNDTRNDKDLMPTDSSPLLHGLPHDASLNGAKVDWMLHFALWSITVLFVIMVLWMMTSIIAHNRKHKAVPLHGNSRKAAWGVIGLSLAIFVFVDGNLFFRTLSELSDTFWDFKRIDADPNVVRIEVNAQQWSWAARYAGKDGIFNTSDDIVSLTDIRVPVGQPVLVELASADVLHSFYLPNFRIKTDAVPGQVNRLWFEAKETGTFDIACAQHCGVNHYKMMGHLIVLSPAEYQDWVNVQNQRAPQTYDANATSSTWGWDWEKDI
jgi:cytochrome c oxidase subunit 2